MPDPTPSDPVTLDAVTELVLRWECQRQGGNEPAIEEICAGRPELREAVARRIGIIKAGEAALGMSGPPLSRAVGDPAAERPLAPLGYEIDRELGRGGMGVVYLARQVPLDRWVALKVLLHGDYAGTQTRQRFHREAMAVAHLAHPNIVQVYEVGEHNGRPFITLEYCPGGSLDAYLDGTPLPPREAARLVQTLAEAMQVAHRANVVHRDLKPGNVLLCRPVSSRPVEAPAREGREYVPKVTDFGLAKKLDEAALTQTGAIMGTPSYMAPEQAAAKKDVGPAADLYALGAILYECLTGRPPFKAATSYDTILQVLSDDPVPPTRLQSNTPQDLETICLKCLHKNPGNRYASAGELAADLQRWQQGEPILARPVGPLERVTKWARRRPTVAALLGTVVAVGLTGLAGILWQWEIARETARRESLALRATRQTLYAAHMNLALSAWNDGNLDQLRLLVRRHLPGPGEEDVRGWEWYHLWQLGQADVLRLCKHQRWVRSLAWSHDGSKLVTGGYDNTPILWDADTGRPIRTFEGHTDAIHRVCFNPDGTLIASASDDQTVRVWQVETGSELACYVHDSKVWAVAFSPDGKRLATVDHGGQAFLHPCPPTQLTSERIPGVPGSSAVAFSPGAGRQLVFACERGQIYLWDMDTKQGRAAQVAPRDCEMFSLAVPATGHVIAVGGKRGALVLWDLDQAKLVHQLQGHEKSIYGLDFTPDGKVLASASWDHLVKLWSVASGQPLATLRGHVEPVKAAAFHPSDPSRLATASKDGTVRLWSLPVRQRPIELATRGEPGRVLAAPAGDLLVVQGTAGVTAWRLSDGTSLVLPEGRPVMGISADGRVLAVSTGRGFQLVDRASGRRLVERTEAHEADLDLIVLSPDGHHVLTGSRKVSQVRLWRKQNDGTLQAVQTQDGVEALAATFSPDSQRVAIQDDTVRVWDLETNDLLSLQDFNDPVAAVAFSPDGKLLATGQTETDRDHTYGSVRVWDATTRAPTRLQPLFGHRAGVAALVFAPDGRTLIAGDGDGLVKCWDLRSGEEKLTLRPSAGAIRALVMSADGRTLATFSAQGEGKPGKVHLWPAASESDVRGYLRREESGQR